MNYWVFNEKKGHHVFEFNFWIGCRLETAWFFHQSGGVEVVAFVVARTPCSQSLENVSNFNSLRFASKNHSVNKTSSSFVVSNRSILLIIHLKRKLGGTFHRKFSPKCTNFPREIGNYIKVKKTCTYDAW